MASIAFRGQLILSLLNHDNKPWVRLQNLFKVSLCLRVIQVRLVCLLCWKAIVRTLPYLRDGYAWIVGKFRCGDTKLFAL